LKKGAKELNNAVHYLKTKSLDIQIDRRAPQSTGVVVSEMARSVVPRLVWIHGGRPCSRMINERTQEIFQQ
jgi:hypothetical protein